MASVVARVLQSRDRNDVLVSAIRFSWTRAWRFNRPFILAHPDRKGRPGIHFNKGCQACNASSASLSFKVGTVQLATHIHRHTLVRSLSSSSNSIRSRQWQSAHVPPDLNPRHKSQLSGPQWLSLAPEHPREGPKSNLLKEMLDTLFQERSILPIRQWIVAGICLELSPLAPSRLT
jgi:hypothetical protein